MEGGGSSREGGKAQICTDALVGIVLKEHPSLQKIWEAVGLDVPTIEKEEDTLREELEQLFKKKYAQVEHKKAEMEKEIARLKNAIAALVALLGDEADVQHDPTKSLCEQLLTLRAAHQNLEKIKADRLAALKALREKLHPLFKHLNWRNERNRKVEPIAEEDDEEKETKEGGEDDKEKTDTRKVPDVVVKTKAQLLVEGKFISSVFFDEISSGLTKKLLQQHEEITAEATAELEVLRATTPTLKPEIIALWKELHLKQEERKKKSDLYVLNKNNSTYEKGKLAYKLLKKLVGKKSKLAAEIERRKNELEKILSHIASLWKLLQIDEDDTDRVNFIAKKDKLPLYSLEQIALCKEEQKRLEVLSKSKLKGLVDDAYAQLKKLWEELHMGDAQKEEFTARLRQAGGKYSCDVLEMLQKEVQILTERLEIMGPLIKLIVRREWIKKQMKVFEKSASNPNRLFGRSTQLLEEEKFRRIVATEFPKLTDTLRESLRKWEKKYKEVFRYEGRSYLETMNEESSAPNFALLHLKLFSGNNNEDLDESFDPDSAANAVTIEKAEPNKTLKTSDKSPRATSPAATEKEKSSKGKPKTPTNPTATVQTKKTPANAKTPSTTLSTKTPTTANTKTPSTTTNTKTATSTKTSKTATATTKATPSTTTKTTTNKTPATTNGGKKTTTTTTTVTPKQKTAVSKTAIATTPTLPDAPIPVPTPMITTPSPTTSKKEGGNSEIRSNKKIKSIADKKDTTAAAKSLFTYSPPITTNTTRVVKVTTIRTIEKAPNGEAVKEDEVVEEIVEDDDGEEEENTLSSNSEKENDEERSKKQVKKTTTTKDPTTAKRTTTTTTTKTTTTTAVKKSPASNSASTTTKRTTTTTPSTQNGKPSGVKKPPGATPKRTTAAGK